MAMLCLCGSCWLWGASTHLAKSEVITISIGLVISGEGQDWSCWLDTCCLLGCMLQMPFAGCAPDVSLQGALLPVIGVVLDPSCPVLVFPCPYFVNFAGEMA